MKGKTPERRSMRRSPVSCWILSSRRGIWEPIGLAFWLPIFAIGTATALNVRESYNFESFGCEQLIASPDSYPYSGLKAVRHKLEHFNNWKSALHRSLTKRFQSGALCYGLRGGGETPARATRSTPKFERSAKKRRHRPAFYHAETGSEEEAGSALHSDRTFRFIIVPSSCCKFRTHSVAPGA
jgi:hypothetical protein